jgi:hypothetical protein
MRRKKRKTDTTSGTMVSRGTMTPAVFMSARRQRFRTTQRKGRQHGKGKTASAFGEAQADWNGNTAAGSGLSGPIRATVGNLESWRDVSDSDRSAYYGPLVGSGPSLGVQAKAGDGIDRGERRGAHQGARRRALPHVSARAVDAGAADAERFGDLCCTLAACLQVFRLRSCPGRSRPAGLCRRPPPWPSRCLQAGARASPRRFARSIVGGRKLHWRRRKTPSDARSTKCLVVAVSPTG